MSSDSYHHVNSMCLLFHLRWKGDTTEIPGGLPSAYPESTEPKGKKDTGLAENCEGSFNKVVVSRSSSNLSYVKLTGKAN